VEPFFGLWNFFRTVEQAHRVIDASKLTPWLHGVCTKNLKDERSSHMRCSGITSWGALAGSIIVPINTIVSCSCHYFGQFRSRCWYLTGQKLPCVCCSKVRSSNVITVKSPAVFCYTKYEDVYYILYIYKPGFIYIPIRQSK
jgi:hypothetical protein